MPFVFSLYVLFSRCFCSKLVIAVSMCVWSFFLLFVSSFTFHTLNWILCIRAVAHHLHDGGVLPIDFSNNNNLRLYETWTIKFFAIYLFLYFLRLSFFLLLSLGCLQLADWCLLTLLVHCLASCTPKHTQKYSHSLLRIFTYFLVLHIKHTILPTAIIKYIRRT